MDTAAFIYSDDLARFDYGDDHPFKPIRARNTLELCNRYGMLYAKNVLRETPVPVETSVLELFHDKDYLDVLARMVTGAPDLEMLERGIGTPDCPLLTDMLAFTKLATGATMLGVELVLAGKARRAFNLVGGFHHAYRDHAEGFCYVNDVGVAIEDLLAKGLKVAFIDVDAHHCNGVQDAFYKDPRVLVVSLHESGKTLYPYSGAETEMGEGEGRGFTVNVPLLEKTDDEVYLYAFEAIVPQVLEAFQPDITLVEIGADTNISDPLTHLRLTTNGYYEVLQTLCANTDKMVAVGGGGYDVYRTTKCWTLAWSAMCEIEPEDDYVGMVGGMMYGAEMDSLFDRPLLTKGEPKLKAQAHAERVTGYLRENLFPILGAKAV